MSESYSIVKQQSLQLANLDKVRQMLAETHTLPEIKKIRDIAEAAKLYAKAAHLGHEVQNCAAEIALLAARKAGEILQRLSKSKGGRPEKTPDNVAVVSEYTKALEETETPERTAQRWQELAAVPQETFTHYIEAVKPKGDISAAGLLNAAKPHVERRKNRNEPVDDFEEVRAVAIKMLNIGLREMRKTEANHSLLDSAKTWAQCKLTDRSETQVAA
jgi:hypothetical protein